jgi:acyl-CoA synthetase (AMP-forming)/AMP-acid ligase II
MRHHLLQGYLHRSAERAPDQVALVDGDRRVTYAALLAEAQALAGFLAAHAGVGRGDRVVVHLENGAEVPAAVFGALEADAVFSVLNPTMKEDKLLYILNHCRARVLIGQARLAETYARLMAKSPSLGTVVLVGAVPGAAPPGVVRWEDALAARLPPPAWRNIDLDLAALVYTSGSTGEPKGVMLTHANLRNTTWAISTYLQNRPDDVILSTLPLSFDYGLSQVLTATRVGARRGAREELHLPPPGARADGAGAGDGLPRRAHDLRHPAVAQGPVGLRAAEPAVLQ